MSGVVDRPRAYAGPYPDLTHRSQAEIMAADADAIAYLDRHARNAARLAASETAAKEDRERANVIRQCAERWAQDLRAGMHHGEAEAWAAVLAAREAAEQEND